MAKINILDSTIFNLISAGEVVDKPMSVVKELVENSIDAGSKHIEIHIENGGIDLIRVVDDGCGIEKDELPKAFMPHATSKIASISDLNNILTLGFRGEALASIAAVSTVTLVSKVEGEELGNTIVYDSGNLVSQFECGCPSGTSVTVEKIFEKIPARQKYLRSAAAEEADIANLVTRLILANPGISFKFVSSSKTIFSTGENEKSALVAVYGNQILNNVDEISLIMPDITIHGFIGKPSFSKHSRNYQTLVVNGRYVKNEEISYMVYLCYKDFLMSRQYPMYLLYIDLPADMVDVNVHPNKMDVKFVQPEKIKKHIRSLINAKLNNIAVLPKEVGEQAKEKEGSTDELFPEKKTLKINFSMLRSGLKEEPAFISTMESKYNFGNKQDSIISNRKEGDKENSFNISKAKSLSSLNNNAAKNTLVSDDITVENFLGEENIMMVGTLFSTYILVESGENCYLIDQHAAHERILYDQLVKEINDGKLAIQCLLIPYTFDVSYEEGEIIDKNLAAFKECGFEIEKNGKSYSISAVPAICSELSFVDFVPMFLNEIDNKARFIKEVLAQSACKAAVKGDRLLTVGEISYLINGINDLQALLCPHGRPIVVKLTKYEVDKWFKRK